MSVLRVFQIIKKKKEPLSRRNPYHKRTASGFISINPGTVLLFFLFLPYLITALAGNSKREENGTQRALLLEQLQEGRYIVINDTVYGKESIPLELYVADELMRSVEETFEMEMLKAQAVLLRTNLITEGSMSVTVSDELYGKKEIPEKYLLATAQTRGICLEYEGNPVYAAYCKVSSGATRNAVEALHSKNYPYLASVICDRDFLSEEYANTIPLKKEEFERIWETLPSVRPDEATKGQGEGMEETSEGKMENTEEATEGQVEEVGEVSERQGEGKGKILIGQEQEFDKMQEKAESFTFIRDSASYILFLQYQNKWVSGEELRYTLHLPSSAFRIEEKEKELLFICKGAGHGLGMSQYGANQMALAGKDYMEILEYFFKGISFTRS